eukprot:6491245-Amphidinium_carterae.1
MAQSTRLFRCCSKCLRDASSEPHIAQVLLYARRASGGMMQCVFRLCSARPRDVVNDLLHKVVVVEVRQWMLDVDVGLLIWIVYCVKEVESVDHVVSETTIYVHQASMLCSGSGMSCSCGMIMRMWLRSRFHCVQNEEGPFKRKHARMSGFSDLSNLCRKWRRRAHCM